MRVQSTVVLAMAAALTLSGCIGIGGDEIEPTNLLPGLDPVTGIVKVTVNDVMGFEKSVVGVAEGYFSDLYEPTIDVSNTGVIYIAGHTILVDTTGAPAFFSKDDGKTWQQLPFLGPVQMPGTIPSATPPPSDEIFIVAGDDGWAYGVDITLFTYPVNMWSGDGAMHAYHNPNAYNRVDSTTQCNPGSVNDRPWAAYANGKLLMVNNAGGGPVQIGVMDVPPAVPVGLGAPVVGTTWNTCASPGGWIPGIPDMRDDGMFMVPQVENQNERLVAVIGNAADVFDLEVVEIMPFTAVGAITSNYGHAVVDAEGQFFVGVVNNTRQETDCPPGGLFANPDRTCYEAKDGRFKLAAYDEATGTFKHRSFATDTPVRHIYMDGNMAGPGALIVFATDGATDGGYDWFVGHMSLGTDGLPVLDRVALAIDEGPMPSAHVTGAALGPDGRAYLAMYERAPQMEYRGSTPLSVFVQNAGPTVAVPLLE